MSEPSSPERRKLGSVEIERRVIGHDDPWYQYRASIGGDTDFQILPMGAAFWATAEQFEALQALALAADVVLDCGACEEELDRIRALGALGKEEGRG